MTHLHSRAICDACRVGRATVEIDSGFFLCDACADTVTQFVLSSVAADAPPSAVNVATAVSEALAPASVAVATNLSQSAPGVDAEVSALEAAGFAYPDLPAFLDRRISNSTVKA